MKLINQIGTQYTATIELPNGVQRVVKLPNKAAYDAVSDNSVQGLINTNERRAKFISAVEEPLFDTPSGYLEEETYAELRPGVMCFMEGGKVEEIDSQYVVNGEVTDTTKVWQ